MWRRLRKIPCLAACASQWRQPSLFGDDTHAVVTRPKWAQGGTHRVVTNVGVLRAWPTDRCSNKDAGKNESKTPTPCENEQAQNSEKRERDSQTK